jgi:ribosomal protein S18 acetylase RimI-like enzyme
LLDHASTSQTGGVGDDDPVELLRLTVADWTVWRDVRLRALSDAPDAFSSTLADWQGDNDVESRWKNRLESVPFNVIAVAAGRFAGQASGTQLNREGYVELISMWVAPEIRGSGVGHSLVDAVVRWAASQAAGGVALSVKRSNTAAIALYESCGFASAPPNPDTPDDEQVMSRPA